MQLKPVLLALLMSLTISPAFAAPLRVVALGDSLTAGYGVQKNESYPAQLQAALQKENMDVVIENAGVSGDTTAGGAARLDSAIAGQVKPALVIVALGANDMLRGVSPVETERNLRGILQKLKQQEIPAILFGMKAYYGLPPAYRQAFNAIYSKLSDEFDVPLYPFFLDGVALNPHYNLGDGVHPNARGIAVMVERTAELVQERLED